MTERQAQLEELKNQLKICYSKRAVLERPTKLTAYDRNETNILKKKKSIEEEIETIKHQIRKLQ